jgi:hypothetical protein
MRRIHWLPALAALALAAAGLPAQVAPPADTTRADSAARRPFVEGGSDDRPYLTHLMGRTAIGGYAEAHARWQQADGTPEESGFLMKRWNIFTSTQVSEVVRIAAELEFEEGGEEIRLEYAAIDLAVHPVLTVRAGAFLAPVGRFNLAHDSPRNDFTDRPLVSTELVGTALTETGIGILGPVPLGGRGRLTYELYAVNGFGDGLLEDSPGGTRIPLGRGNFEDNNGSPAFTGRLAWSPRLGWEMAVSGHHGAYNRFVVDGERIDERRDVTLAAVDFEATVAAVELSGEVVRAVVELPQSLRGVFASRQQGIYLQAVLPFGEGWVATLPRARFGAGVRVDHVDFDADLAGDAASRVTLGLSFRPTSDTILKLDYLRGRVWDRFNNRGDGAGVLFSVATYF